MDQVCEPDFRRSVSFCPRNRKRRYRQAEARGHFLRPRDLLAARYSFEEALIASVETHSHLRVCLFAQREHNLEELLREGATDEEIADFILAAVWKKEAGHKIDQPDFVRPSRFMATIGG
jgi:hypothetical protein